MTAIVGLVCALAGAASAAKPRPATIPAATTNLVMIILSQWRPAARGLATKCVISTGSSVGGARIQRLIDSGEHLFALDEGDAPDAKQGAQLLSRNSHRPRRRSRSRRRLRKADRQRGVECDVALHLLYDLMNVTVEHRHRTEPFEGRQCLLRIVGAPTPVLVDRPQRNMSEDDDRRGCGETLHIVGEPGELLGAQNTHAAGLEVHHADESDEMDAIVVERIPAGALGVLAVALEVGLARRFVDEVVFARHVVHVEPGGADDLSGIVELFLRLKKWEC